MRRSRLIGTTGPALPPRALSFFSRSLSFSRSPIYRGGERVVGVIYGLLGMQIEAGIGERRRTHAPRIRAVVLRARLECPEFFRPNR